MRTSAWKENRVESMAYIKQKLYDLEQEFNEACEMNEPEYVLERIMQSYAYWEAMGA